MRAADGKSSGSFAETCIRADHVTLGAGFPRLTRLQPSSVPVV
jgi:hypothetical protein